jgi:predicted CXXCH cytochrome family protein
LLPETFAEQRRDADVVDAVCAQCHSGPSPRLVDGTALRNSSEALDLRRSPCRGIRCTDCHDPHRADARADTARSLAACTRCHERLAEPATARLHAGRGHDGATCLDCHMPRVVMGIDRFVRTHRISSPSDARLIAEDAPNACNLCHLDRTLRWTVAALRDGWDVRLSPHGPIDDPAGVRWLASASPALRILATDAFSRSPFAAGSLRELARGLDDPLAYVRSWTKLSLESVLGRPLSLAEYDPRAPAPARARAIAALLAKLTAATRH